MDVKTDGIGPRLRRGDAGRGPHAIFAVESQPIVGKRKAPFMDEAEAGDIAVMRQADAHAFRHRLSFDGDAHRAAENLILERRFETFVSGEVT